MIRVLFPIALNLVGQLALKFDKSFEESIAAAGADGRESGPLRGSLIEGEGATGIMLPPKGFSISSRAAVLLRPFRPHQTSRVVSRFMGAIVGILYFL